jgi:two-component system, cell cycle response regulator DivK
MSLLNLEDRIVLVVEDDEMSFLYLKQLFMLTRCTLFRAKSGSEALEIFRNNQLDLILMDIQLPDMQGTAVTREIRFADRKVPIIAQTAGKTTDDREKAMEAGCSDVIVKPFSMEELFGAVRKYL